MSDTKLKVQEAMQNDVGRGIVRIDTETRQELGLTSGDIVSVKGKNETVGIVWQCYPQDEGLKVIRMDGILRQNAGVGIGDYVNIAKTNIVPAEKITLAPSQPVRFSPGFESYVQKRLVGRPLIKGDRILVGVFGTSLVMMATKTSPKGFVQITAETQIDLKTEPAKEVANVPQVTYEDIGGVKDEVNKVREMIEIPLKHPELFERLGIEPPKGVLLHGAPGTGKTLLAKAIAHESEANFVSIQGPEIISKFVGEAEERVRQIFKQAQENAPTIIFIDEIDAIAPKRGEVQGEVEKRVVAQLLASMDGLQARGNVVVIAATNRPDAIDEALRRPGRFDREIELGAPDRKGRKEILQIHTRNMPITKDVDLDRLAEITHGYVGADLESLCKEAAMKTLRRLIPQISLDADEGISSEVLDNLMVTKDDFMAAFREIQPSAMREVLVEVPNVKWEDIGGLEKVKTELKEAIEWPLKNPQMFTRLGIRPPKGIFLFGPPGTGKTLLAKAVATESETNFIAVKGPELLVKWVGDSEKGVREVFRKARLAAPVVILFDEIDAIAPRRGFANTTQTHEGVVNQILAEMDGIEEMRDVVVLATSNRPDIVDPGLLRPGRFDRMIAVPAPDEESRLAIFKVHTKKMPLNFGHTSDEKLVSAIDWRVQHLKEEVKTSAKEAAKEKEDLARALLALKESLLKAENESEAQKVFSKSDTQTRTECVLSLFAIRSAGFSGADIEGVCREAAMNALRRSQESKEVTLEDFEKSMKAAKPSIQEDDLKKYSRFMEEQKVVDNVNYIG